MRTSTLVILAAGLLSATTLKWSELKRNQTLGQIYKEAKAGRLRMSAYKKFASLASFAMIVFGMYLALSGD
jgi:hypothetical protein